MYEIGRQWDCNNAKVIPLVVEVLGTVGKDFEKFVDYLGVDLIFSTLQIVCSLLIRDCKNPKESPRYLRLLDAACCPAKVSAETSKTEHYKQIILIIIILLIMIIVITIIVIIIIIIVIIMVIIIMGR